MKRLSIASVSIKIWMVLVVLLLFISIILVITISNTASKVVVIPQLFSPDAMKFGHFVETTNMKVPVKEKKLIDEMFVRFYIENRNNYIPNLSELSYRYGGRGPIARLSAPAVFSQFLGQIGNYAENIQQDGSPTTRAIDITSVTRQDNTFSVDFDVYQFDEHTISRLVSKRATVRIAHSPAYRNFSSDFANPYGFVVVFYKESLLKKH